MARGKHLASRRRRTPALLIVMAMVGAAFAVAPIAGAGPAPKVDVCHYDADAGTFHLINISDNAFQKHLDHGDAAPGSPVPGVPHTVFGPDCATAPGPGGHAYTVGGATALSPFNGLTTLTFDVWDTAPFGSMVYGATTTAPWSGDVVSAIIGTTTASFVVRVDIGHPLVVGCDVTIAVTEGGVGAGTWDIASVVASPSESCGAIGGVQGPYTISAGEIVIDS